MEGISLYELLRLVPGSVGISSNRSILRELYMTDPEDLLERLIRESCIEEATEEKKARELLNVLEIAQKLYISVHRRLWKDDPRYRSFLKEMKISGNKLEVKCRNLVNTLRKILCEYYGWMPFAEFETLEEKDRTPFLKKASKRYKGALIYWVREAGRKQRVNSIVEPDTSKYYERMVEQIRQYM